MYNGLLKSFLITLAAFVAVFLLFAPSWSADWEVSPCVEIIEEYNDNILFSSKGQELDDFVTYVRPRVEAKYSTDRLRMSLNSGLEREIYVDYDELNTTNHDHKLALSYGLSRTLGLRAGGVLPGRHDIGNRTYRGRPVGRSGRPPKVWWKLWF